MNKDELRQELAAYAHDTWANYVEFLLRESREGDAGTIIIPTVLVDKLNWRTSLPYESLPEEIQQSYLEEADRMLKIMEIERVGKTKQGQG